MARPLKIEYRWAQGHYDGLPALAAELVAAKVDVIAASGGDRSAEAAKGATSRSRSCRSSAATRLLPGWSSAIARPGGNLTGVSFLTAQLMPKTA